MTKINQKNTKLYTPLREVTSFWVFNQLYGVTEKHTLFNPFPSFLDEKKKDAKEENYLRLCAATKSWSKYTTINCCEVISLLDVVSRFCKQVSLKHNIQGILVTVFEVNSQKSFQVFNRSLGHKFLSKTVLKS